MTDIGAGCIAVDWGTSNLRLWHLGPDGAVLHEAHSDRGMNRLSGPAEFEQVLLDLAGDWLGGGGPRAVAVCGMAGARNGWQEAPYRAVPCAPVQPGALVAVPTHDRRIRVRIVPGLRQNDPPDVMRGEETQLAGLLAVRPDFEGAVCLPGTHSKWVRLEAGLVTRFSTVMTGELFHVLSTQSILRLTATTDGWDEEAFLEAAREGFGRPETVLSGFFQLRAGPLLEGWPPERVRARLSGLLIGAELAAMRGYWDEGVIHVVGSGTLARAYVAALSALGHRAVAEDAEALTLAGLKMAAQLRVEGEA